MSAEPTYTILVAYVIVTDPTGKEIRYPRGATVPAAKLYTAPRYLKALVEEGAIALSEPPPPEEAR